MTLYRQLVVTIVTLFTACFLISVTISTGNLRSFLGEQLESHAQDTATSLGLSLSPYMQRNDTTVMSSMVDAIFDRGYFRSISVIAVNGEPLIERSNPATSDGIPSWFIDYIDLRLSAAEAMVMSGWKQAATVVVVSNPGYAYQELWENCLDTLVLFSLTALASILLGILAIHLLLKPLKRVEEQAESICQLDFVTQDKLPRTRELRRVVEAMNRLAGKVSEIFTEQLATTEQLREQAYKDPVTGLGNRRYFDRQLQTMLESSELSSGGAILLLELSQLEQVNAASGYQSGDILLHRTAELIEKRLAGFGKYFAARISGAGFGIVVEAINNRETDALADAFVRDLLQLHTEHLVEDSNIAHIGTAIWESGDSMSEVLAEADNALRAAQAMGAIGWHRHEPTDEAPRSMPGAEQWHTRLMQAISSRCATLCAQPVLEFTDSGDEVLHREIFLRLQDENNGFLTAGVFMPMAERTGLAAGMDRLAIGTLLDYLTSNPADTSRYAVNLAASSLHDPALVEWLCKELQEKPGCAQRIAVEFPESGVLADIPNTRTVVDRLSSLGCNCGIDHFGRSFNSFGYLRSLKVRYLKIDGGYTRDINRESDNQFFVRALADTAHSVDIRVFTEAVESAEELDAIRLLNVDGVQGYLVGKPEFL